LLKKLASKKTTAEGFKKSKQISSQQLIEWAAVHQSALECGLQLTLHGLQHILIKFM